MTKIFLSYRREDSADVVGRIFDHLERRFGRDSVFLDVDTIRYGDDFHRRVGEALDHTDVLLAIIEITGSTRQTEPGSAAAGGSTTRTTTSVLRFQLL
jgi:hypothetical protein